MEKEAKIIFHPILRQWIELTPAELRRIKQTKKKIWSVKPKSSGEALID